MDPQEDITGLLCAWSNGDRDALDRLVPAVYDELRKLGRSYLRRDRPGHTLQTTALVNEAYLRLVKQGEADIANRAHFFAIAAGLMRQILVKHARAAHVPVSEKRRHGMHSLRHSLATRLMESGTPVEQIADILGHQSVESTGVYLKSSLGLLAKCALDPDAPANGASR